MIIIKEHEIEWKYILVPSMLPIKFIKVYLKKIKIWNKNINFYK